MSKFGWNPETGGAGASPFPIGGLKKGHISLSATRLSASLAERRRQCYVQRSFPTICISVSSTINTITLYSIRKLDLPALECLIMPGTQLPFAAFPYELWLFGATGLKE